MITLTMEQLLLLYREHWVTSFILMNQEKINIVVLLNSKLIILILMNCFPKKQRIPVIFTNLKFFEY
jgi:hypothetical protein